MRLLIIAIGLAVATPVMAGVDDDNDVDPCDGRRVAYDEVALVGPDRVPVRYAAAGCRRGVIWLFLVGGDWGESRVVATGIGTDGFAKLWRAVAELTALPTCGAGVNPSDIWITATPGATIHCAVGFERKVADLVSALKAAPRRTARDDDFRFEDGVVEDDLVIVPPVPHF